MYSGTVRRVIVYSGVYSYALRRRVEIGGIYGIPTYCGRVESVEAHFLGSSNL